ncbi:hypothetical protein [Paenibacillus sp. y28]|uniref:hypothetical protein n=1 Tax=Paenibacillus sp. y28 TaxID=3129110 RepID=UPI00301A76E5
MKEIYHAYQHGYELYVKSGGNGFHVVHVPFASSRGETVLHVFPTAVEAVAAAKRFPELEQTARIRGFVLEGGRFAHSDGRSVDVSFAMDPRLTVEQFRALFSQ